MVIAGQAPEGDILCPFRAYKVKVKEREVQGSFVPFFILKFSSFTFFFTLNHFSPRYI